MKDLKKRSIVRAMLFFATLLLSLATVASADDDGTCSMSQRAGEYGLTATGTMILPTGGVPYAAVGKSIFDDAGNFSSTQTVSVGGTVRQLTVRGTYTQNSDCTGTVTASSYDQSGNLLNNATWATVSVDNMSEVRLIMTSLVQANGTSVPTVITMNAKKLFPKKENKQEE